MSYSFLSPMAFGGLDLIDDDLELIDTDAQIMDIQIDDSIVIDWDYLDEIFSTCGPMESSSASLSPCAATQKRMKLPPTLSPSAKEPPVQYLTSLPHRPTEGKQAKKKSKKAAKPCTVPNCTNKVRTRGVCKAHGGGKRCHVPGCNTCTVGGLFCIKHNGGKRCLHPGGCAKAVQSRGLCKAHGGGARCTVDGCSRSSQGSGLCTAHGGGKRCTVASCSKTAQRLGRCSKHACERIDDGDVDEYDTYYL
ncbi:Aste57867_24288 [Aphanomyces stellatus]|uniref:Aste57867_24288 protein n=1 Tax=Aphanomyces stellatus TaxID=120398 RepID=A0A485LUD9_9STRA|nr:hypothetical protein As57867_024213 [Aphanomyces stellatus]VFU00928.1 Aste57867_24288 [Aphanomyces stellatus]